MGQNKEYELGELLEYEQPTKYIVKSTDYDASYRIPVLTAGKSFILGYTNDNKNVFDKLPVIIFDDFTTAIQYVNFKFKVKSSAMKILNVNTKLVLPKYIYYRMQSIVFDHSTHKRYWIQEYSKIKISVPPLPEQERIVSQIEELFSQLDKSVDILKNNKQQLVVYRQSVLKEAFCNTVQKKTIREMSSIVTSGSRGWAKYYSDHGASFIRIGNLSRTKIDIDLDNIQYVLLPENAEGTRSQLQPNDVLVSITADLGSIGLVPNKIEDAYINQHIAMIRFKNNSQGKFMAWYLRSEYGQKDLLKNKRGGGKLGLGLNDIRDTKVPVVSNEEADKIVTRIESQISVCNDVEAIVNTVLTQTEIMRQRIIKKAFEE